MEEFMKLSFARWFAPLVITVLISGPAFAGAGISTSTAATTSPRTPTSLSLAAGTSTSSAAAGDVASYAAREKQAQGLETFKGGAGVSIYLGGSALALVVLLLVLLIIF